MLIQFSVANYLSFYEKQTLSMVADSSTELQDSHTFLPTGKAKLPRLLHTAAIYGANAAGKTNLLSAINLMRKIVLSSAKESQAGELIKGICPHALYQNEPTEFEIIFILDEVRYQYGFTATSNLIMEEWLFAFPSGRSQRWLGRIYKEESKKYEWLINSTFVKGQKELWKDSTRDNALFLSTAALLNSEQFGKIIEWFTHHLQDLGQNISPKETLNLLENTEGKTKVLDFLNTADITIEDIQILEKVLTVDMLPNELPVEIKQKIFADLRGENNSLTVKEIKFIHRLEQKGETPEEKTFALPLSLESRGTHKLFEITGLWLKNLEEGRIICIDELERSLHPFITRFLVGLFNDPETNPKHAQLIFTTHDTTVLDNDLLRRDQIWFVEKDGQQTTQLYPLSDFSPRKDEALQKGYLRGRYGALPYISTPQWLK